MEIGFRSLMIIIGISQGALFALLLLITKKYKSIANQFLALVILALMIITLRMSGIISAEIFNEIFEYFSIEYLMPPFLFLYVKKSYNQKVSIKSNILLFTPFVVFSLIHTLISLADIFDFEALGAVLEEVEFIEFYAVLFYVFIIILLSFRIVRQNLGDPVFMKWLYFNFSAFTILVVLLLISEVLENLYELNYWGFSWTAISIFLMSVSFFGLQQVNIEQQRSRIRALQNPEKRPDPKRKTTSSNDHFDRLTQLMTEQEVFKNPILNRGIIAETLGISPSTISRILKENCGQNLTEFINKYRVDHAKQMLDDPRYDIFSLEAIGKESGFKSRSSFYETFKKSTSMTPGNYKKR